MENLITYHVSAGEGNARYASAFEVGGHVLLWGRIQSSEYMKRIGENETQKRIAYEVSVSINQEWLEAASYLEGTSPIFLQVSSACISACFAVI